MVHLILFYFVDCIRITFRNFNIGIIQTLPWRPNLTSSDRNLHRDNYIEKYIEDYIEDCIEDYIEDYFEDYIEDYID